MTGHTNVMNDAKSFLTLIVNDPQTAPSGNQTLPLVFISLFAAFRVLVCPSIR